MTPDLKTLTNFLVSLGVDKIAHTKKTYLAHVIGVYRDLEARGFDRDVCLAGMFHSIYGTEMFQRFKLPLDRRQEIRDLIGERAERIAYYNCVMDRGSFYEAAKSDGEAYTIVDRLTRQPITMNRQDFDDLCRVHFYDWMEQVARSGMWDYQRDSFRRLAHRLGSQAIADFEQVFANAPA
ncbi:MAG: hypothetical protein KatS3mg105_1125 [Gemmatales bacterium]|nr:MAG: hypothetical protein KatS3mg105_1125 [Gemmatales bacterium]